MKGPNRGQFCSSFFSFLFFSVLDIFCCCGRRTECINVLNPIRNHFKIIIFSLVFMCIMHALYKTRPLFFQFYPFFIGERLIMFLAYELGDQPIRSVHFLLVYMYIFFSSVPCLCISVWVLYEESLVTHTCHGVFVLYVIVHGVSSRRHNY